MSKSPSKESDIHVLSLIGTSVECYSSVMDSACDAHQNNPGSIPPRAGFLSAALPESSLLGTSTDLQISLPGSRVKFLFTLIHQSIKGMTWVRKSGPRLRSYVPLIRR